MADSKNIFVVIRNDISDVRNDIKAIQESDKITNSTLKIIENSVDNLPIGQLADDTTSLLTIVTNMKDTLKTSVDNINTNLAGIVQQVNVATDKQFETLGSQIKDTVARLQALDTRISAVSTNITAFTSQLNAFQKDNNLKIDTLNTTITNQLNAFQKDSKANIDNVLSKINAITNILRPLG
ncbi:hypothetical protein [Mamestra configurata nucleopolyhedrovirus B]|uniref:Maco-B 118 n=1 Tax=Mamestra configurata nucleopolyhedrovirus B TaxID=204440 RepID=Q8JM36_9ABAC|nr:hypothetical protein McnBVgp117 [Mamestra configurata nucleopolyhedrovirus B]AAM95104.1 hypothetical protein [Mamestra configurata nucleopolyhedrovirus B]QNH90760.1 maco-B 118 [Mamestra configurata nucleopolyhedrovirus B]WHN38775.1 hypothetical protein Mb_orf112 [Mamestra brassicae multiple nucleopolyhedrovirus]